MTPTNRDETIAIMLSALRKAEDFLGGPTIRVASSDPSFPVLEAIREAIAKAEGR